MHSGDWTGTVNFDEAIISSALSARLLLLVGWGVETPKTIGIN